MQPPDVTRWMGGCSSDMAKYGCSYIENGARRSQHDIEAADDAAALLRAEELLAGSGFATMEVCQGARLVGRVTMGTPAELTQTESSPDE